MPPILTLEIARRMAIKAIVKQAADELAEAEQERLLHEAFGNWQSDIAAKNW